ncbi:hypothetical protein AgCh_019372 [Apium graveolens]
MAHDEAKTKEGVWDAPRLKISEQHHEKKGLEVCQTTARPPARRTKLGRILYGSEWCTDHAVLLITALILQSLFIHQTWSPVSLEIKNKEVHS